MNLLHSLLSLYNVYLFIIFFIAISTCLWKWFYCSRTLLIYHYIHIISAHLLLILFNFKRNESGLSFPPSVYSFVNEEFFIETYFLQWICQYNSPAVFHILSLVLKELTHWYDKVSWMSCGDNWTIYLCQFQHCNYFHCVATFPVTENLRQTSKRKWKQYNS